MRCPAQSWGSVYYFCGDELQYCKCNLRWNLAGWAKACFLWNFVLGAALGWQKLIIQVGLDGLLAGATIPPQSHLTCGISSWGLVSGGRQHRS